MKRLMSTLIFVVMICQIVFGQTIAVQGVLRDPAGRTVVDGSHAVVFKLYDAETGGAELWSESLGSVMTSHGVFSEQLGTVSSLADLRFTEQYWLGIKVDDGSEISQRLALQSSPAANALTGSANIVPSIGNVGIGTITPNSDLEIQSSENGSKLKVNSSHTGTAPIFEVEQTNSDGKLSVRNAGGATISQLSGYSETPTYFNTSVGIGTETPTEPLEVAGNVKLSDGGAVIFSDGSSLATADLGGSASAVATPGNALITADADEANAGEIQFKTGTSTDMVITNDGNVGIGLTIPTHRFEVEGTSFFRDRLMLMRQGGPNYIDFLRDNDLRFRSMNSDDTDITDILSISPSGVLDVGSGGSIYPGAFKIIASGSSGVGIAAAVAGRFMYLIASTSTMKLDAYDYQNNVALDFTLGDNGGNVGVNNSSPDGKLSIDSDGDGSLFNLHTSHADDSKIFEVEQSGSDGLVSVRSASGATKTQLSGYSGTPSYFLSNVGIGNINPQAQLDVGSGASHNGQGNFQIMATGTGSAGMAANVGLRSIYLFATPTQMKLDAYDYENDTALDIGIAPNGGNVGIGTTTPASKLDVSGRITRHGQALSEAGVAVHGQIITVPWGSRDDWNIFVSPRELGYDETGSLGDNAMMMIRCAADINDGSSWLIFAEYLYRNSDSHSSASWNDGSANYILVAK